MVTDMLQRVRSYLSQKGVTKAGLAIKAGLHPNTLRDADQEDWNPTAATLKALEPHLPQLPTPPAEPPSPTKIGENVRGGGEDAARPFSPTSSATSGPEEDIESPPPCSTGPTPMPAERPQPDRAEWPVEDAAA